MVVHWAGEKSNVIVALARDSAAATGPKTSSVRAATVHVYTACRWTGFHLKLCLFVMASVHTVTTPTLSAENPRSRPSGKVILVFMSSAVVSSL